MVYTLSRAILSLYWVLLKQILTQTRCKHQPISWFLHNYKNENMNTFILHLVIHICFLYFILLTLSMMGFMIKAYWLFGQKYEFRPSSNQNVGWISYILQCHWFSILNFVRHPSEAKVGLSFTMSEWFLYCHQISSFSLVLTFTCSHLYIYFHSSAPSNMFL